MKTHQKLEMSVCSRYPSPGSEFLRHKKRRRRDPRKKRSEAWSAISRAQFKTSNRPQRGLI